MDRRRQGGMGLVLAAVVLLAAVGLLAMQWSDVSPSAQRERVTARALAQAREALIAYAADRPISAAVGPGYLPCPDLDNDGWAEATCGSLTGESGQAQRLGRLPWKTLGLPDLRDADGERLWYAVSSKHKGLLNCAASRACVDLSPPAALGTITLRDRAGTLIHDGTVADAARASAGGALAVVIAPGAPIVRVDGLEQRRGCDGLDCDPTGRCLTEPPQRAARCAPANYLDRAPAGEDNADFVDRNDAAGRPRNTNGFIDGPVSTASGGIAVNDRLAAISYDDVMPRVMLRVALEVGHCLRFYATRPENREHLPWPAPLCESSPFVGKVPDTPFAASGAPAMLSRWWRAEPRVPEQVGELPTAAQACRIALPPYDEGPVRTSVPGTPGSEGETAGHEGPSWWNTWKNHVFYALAGETAPGAGVVDCREGTCIALVDTEGRVSARGKHFAVLVRRSADCPRQRFTCGPSGCSSVLVPPRGSASDVLAAFP